MVSRYGEKFEKAVDKAVKVKVAGRTLFLVAAVVAFAIWSVFFGLAVGSEDDWDEASVRLWAALIALPYILPISIFLYVGLNKDISVRIQRRSRRNSRRAVRRRIKRGL